MNESELDFETLAVQSGLRTRIGDSISTAPPIVPSTTFTHESIEGVHAALSPDGGGFAYARNANPTVVALEAAVARLETAAECVAFGSGMAAVHAALLGPGLAAGDIVLAASDLYGVSRALLVQLENYDIKAVLVDVLDPDGLEHALDEYRPRLLFLESISNPLLKVPDVASIVTAAKQHRCLVALDNTFATPYLFRPIRFGVDIVIHSATKYMGGHGDAVAGFVSTHASLARRIRDMRTLTGGIVSPFEAWLTLRGMRTLPVRMARHCASAAELAAWLQGQEWVKRVYYPGLEHHAQRETAARQFGDRFGGMLSFDLDADRAGTLRFLDSLQLVTPGTSLGDVESLVLYPPLSSHRALCREELGEAGIGDGLVRMSVGLESVGDLIADLERAARSVASPSRVHDVS